MDQARDNLGALGWGLSSGEVSELDKVAKGIGKSGRMVQNIFQTK